MCLQRSVPHLQHDLAHLHLLCALPAPHHHRVPAVDLLLVKHVAARLAEVVVAADDLAVRKNKRLLRRAELSSWVSAELYELYELQLATAACRRLCQANHVLLQVM
jgi:hypothetical protein